mmetsp:Transcript_16739/g.37736  ORF Transcript_16739/g.37736 Transcript_16739/m.37736 type:complete len:263 (+) Transcript_16739:185-973(+)
MMAEGLQMKVLHAGDARTVEALVDGAGADMGVVHVEAVPQNLRKHRDCATPATLLQVRDVPVEGGRSGEEHCRWRAANSASLVLEGHRLAAHPGNLPHVAALRAGAPLTLAAAIPRELAEALLTAASAATELAVRARGALITLCQSGGLRPLAQPARQNLASPGHEPFQLVAAQALEGDVGVLLGVWLQGERLEVVGRDFVLPLLCVLGALGRRRLLRGEPLPAALQGAEGAAPGATGAALVPGAQSVLHGVFGRHRGDEPQ